MNQYCDAKKQEESLSKLIHLVDKEIKDTASTFHLHKDCVYNTSKMVLLGPKYKKKIIHSGLSKHSFYEYSNESGLYTERHLYIEKRDFQDTRRKRDTSKYDIFRISNLMEKIHKDLCENHLNVFKCDPSKHVLSWADQLITFFRNKGEDYTSDEFIEEEGRSLSKEILHVDILAASRMLLREMAD